MSTTDGGFSRDGAMTREGDALDLQALEQVTTSAREYAAATSRLASAYTSYVQALRTLSSAQGAVHEAAQAMRQAEQALQESGHAPPAHPIPPHAPRPSMAEAQQARQAPDADRPAPGAASPNPVRESEPVVSPEPAPLDPPNDAGDGVAGASLLAKETRELPAIATTEARGPRLPDSAGSVHFYSSESEEDEAQVAPDGGTEAVPAQTDAPVARDTGGLKVIPRFIGNPPPARAP